MLTIAILWCCTSILSLALFGLTGAREDDEPGDFAREPADAPPLAAVGPATAARTTA